MKAIERRSRAVRLAEALDRRMAQAGGKEWKAYIKGLGANK